VISIVGRFLEHSRIYYFLNAGSEVLFMGSADLMPRNLNQRVEVHFPIEEPDKIRYIHDGVLQVYLKDRFKARQMLSDNTYVRLKPSPGEEQINAQDRFKAHAQRPMEL
jgi:polyphosphate kinase